MGALAGIIGELVRNGQATAKDDEKIWLSGVLGPNDLQGLLEMHRKDDRNTQDKKKVGFEEPEKSEAEKTENESPEM